MKIIVTLKQTTLNLYLKCIYKITYTNIFLKLGCISMLKEVEMEGSGKYEIT